jgi:hypothetical protein
MRSWCLRCALAFLAFTSASFAGGDTSEVRPGRNDLPATFVIVSKPLPNGDTQFTVTISDKIGAQSGYVEYAKEYTTSLGIMTIVDHMKENPPPPGPLRSETASPIRTLPSEHRDNVIKCVFTVTPEEFKNPDLVFFFNVLSGDGLPGISIFYARLRKFLKPPGS